MAAEMSGKACNNIKLVLVTLALETEFGATAVAFSPDCEFLARGDMEGRMHIFPVKDLLSKN